MSSLLQVGRYSRVSATLGWPWKVSWDWRPDLEGQGQDFGAGLGVSPLKGVV